MAWVPRGWFWYTGTAVADFNSGAEGTIRGFELLEQRIIPLIKGGERGMAELGGLCKVREKRESRGTPLARTRDLRGLAASYDIDQL